MDTQTRDKQINQLIDNALLALSKEINGEPIRGEVVSVLTNALLALEGLKRGKS